MLSAAGGGASQQAHGDQRIGDCRARQQRVTGGGICLARMRDNWRRGQRERDEQGHDLRAPTALQAPTAATCLACRNTRKRASSVGPVSFLRSGARPGLCPASFKNRGCTKLFGERAPRHCVGLPRRRHELLSAHQLRLPARMLWVKDLGISVVVIAAGDGVHGVRIFHDGVGRINSSRGVRRGRGVWLHLPGAVDDRCQWRMIMEHLKRAFAVGPREQLVEHDVGGKGGAVAVRSRPGRWNSSCSTA